MKRTLIAGAAFASLFAAASASAADLPIYPKAAPAAVYDWTGFYLGTNVGYSWGRGSTTGTSTGLQEVSTFVTNGGAVPPGPLLTDVFTPLAGGVFSGRSDIKGFLGGGQLGYNWQIGSWLAGLEADVQASGERGRVTLVPTGVAPALPRTTRWTGLAPYGGALASWRLNAFWSTRRAVWLTVALVAARQPWRMRLPRRRPAGLLARA